MIICHALPAKKINPATTIRRLEVALKRLVASVISI
jgi:hypothetical protein